MNDLHRFPDSLARILRAAELRAAQLDASADNVAAVRLYEVQRGHVDPKDLPGDRPAEMRAEANQLRDDVARWRSLLEAAERFADDVARSSPASSSSSRGFGVQPPDPMDR